jgi:hypothetical protein
MSESLLSVGKVTIIADSALEKSLIDDCVQLGAHDYASSPCKGKTGRHEADGDQYNGPLVRIEVLARSVVADAILAQIRQRGQSSEEHVVAFMETVAVHEDRFVD